MVKNDDFESKLNDAKQIIEQLNKPDVTLNESLKLYENGIKTLKEASKMLENAKLVLVQEEQK